MKENEITKEIVDACFKVHKELGPGLLEIIYEHCLIEEFSTKGMFFERQKELPVFYKGKRLDHGCRMDFCVEEKVVVELKAVDVIADLQVAQMLTYLRLSDLRLGLIVNFNSALIKNGIRRVILSAVPE